MPRAHSMVALVASHALKPRAVPGRLGAGGHVAGGSSTAWVETMEQTKASRPETNSVSARSAFGISMVIQESRCSPVRQPQLCMIVHAV